MTKPDSLVEARRSLAALHIALANVEQRIEAFRADIKTATQRVRRLEKTAEPVR